MDTPSAFEGLRALAAAATATPPDPAPAQPVCSPLDMTGEELLAVRGFCERVVPAEVGEPFDTRCAFKALGAAFSCWCSQRVGLGADGQDASELLSTLKVVVVELRRRYELVLASNDALARENSALRSQLAALLPRGGPRDDGGTPAVATPQRVSRSGGRTHGGAAFTI